MAFVGRDGSGREDNEVTLNMRSLKGTGSRWPREKPGSWWQVLG
jgi:hypothetical protein